MARLRRTAAGAVIVILVAVASVAGGVWRTPPVEGRVLEIELQTSAGAAAQIFWDDGSGFSEAHSSRAALHPTPGSYQIVRFTLPNGTIRTLRVDPSDAAAEILIRRMAVRDSSGAQIAELNAGSLVPLHHVASMIRDGAVTRIATPPSGSDPALLVTTACLDGQSSWYELSSVTPLSLAGALFLLIALLGATGWVIVRELLERTLPSIERNRKRVWGGLLWMVVLFGVTVSAKLYLLREHPSPVPWLDQWSIEPRLYVPFAEGCLSWAEMMAFHNEHRIFFAKVLALGLFVSNAQWDPQLQQVVNVFVHSSVAVLLATMLYLTSERRRLDLAVLACAAMFAVPFGWENVIFGFQSAFYLFVWFSVVAIWLTLRFEPGTVPWALGWMSAAASLLTAASGIATVAVVLLATTSKALGCGQPRWHLLANVLPSVCLLGIGVSTMPPPLPQHEVYRAATIADGALAFGRNLAWPWVDQPWLLTLMWGPLLVLIATRLTRRHAEASHEWWMYALGVWAIGNAALLAYARGAGGVEPASRYMDFLSLGPIVNLGAVASLIGLMPRNVFKRTVAAAALAAWAVTLFVGVDRITQHVFVNLNGVSTWLAQHTENLRHFVATDDLTTLATKTFPAEVPFYDPTLLANAWLRHPYLRDTLPPEIRRPLPLAAMRITGEGFVRDGFYPSTPADPLRPAWGSFTMRQNPAQGEFESTVVHECPRSFLRFDVAGYLTSDGLSIGTQDVSSGRYTQLAPPELAREKWVPAFVACDGPFKVVAVDANPNLWFAFRDPVEYGPGSWIAKQLVDRSRGLLLCFAALALVAIRIGWGEPLPRTPSGSRS